MSAIEQVLEMCTPLPNADGAEDFVALVQEATSELAAKDAALEAAKKAINRHISCYGWTEDDRAALRQIEAAQKEQGA